MELRLDTSSWMMLFVVLTSITLLATVWASFNGVFDPSTGQVIAMSLLVFANMLLLVVAHLDLNENKNAREQEFMPLFNLEKGNLGRNTGLKLVNIGNGPAQDIQVSVSINPGGESIEVRRQNIREGDYATVISPVKNLDESEDQINLEEIQGEFESIEVKGECKDIFGNSREVHGVYDLGELLEREHFADRNGQEQNLRDIVYELRDIRRALR